YITLPYLFTTTIFFYFFFYFFFLMIPPPPTSTLFPSRRSSDLIEDGETSLSGRKLELAIPSEAGKLVREDERPWRKPAGDVTNRSEEHTSELQSRRDLVCRLLLEKKKKKKKKRKNQKEKERRRD